MFPSLRAALFEGNGRAGYSAARVDPPQVKATIISSAEFKSYQQQVAAIFDAWRKTHEPLLLGIEVNAPPRTVIIIDPVRATMLGAASPTWRCSTAATTSTNA